MIFSNELIVQKYIFSYQNDLFLKKNFNLLIKIMFLLKFR